MKGADRRGGQPVKGTDTRGRCVMDAIYSGLGTVHEGPTRFPVISFMYVGGRPDTFDSMAGAADPGP